MFVLGRVASCLFSLSFLFSFLEILFNECVLLMLLQLLLLFE